MVSRKFPGAGTFPKGFWLEGRASGCWSSGGAQKISGIHGKMQEGS